MLQTVHGYDRKASASTVAATPKSDSVALRTMIPSRRNSISSSLGVGSESIIPFYRRPSSLRGRSAGPTRIQALTLVSDSSTLASGFERGRPEVTTVILGRYRISTLETAVIRVFCAFPQRLRPYRPGVFTLRYADHACRVHEPIFALLPGLPAASLRSSFSASRACGLRFLRRDLQNLVEIRHL